MVYKDQSEPQIKRRRNEECIIKQKYSVRTSSSPQCVVSFNINSHQVTKRFPHGGRHFQKIYGGL